MKAAGDDGEGKEEVYAVVVVVIREVIENVPAVGDEEGDPLTRGVQPLLSRVQKEGKCE